MLIQHYQRRYPLDLPDWTFIDVLHNSTNAVIFLAENTAGQRAAIKRFKFRTDRLDDSAIEHFHAGIRQIETQHYHGLVRLWQGGINHGVIYLVMEFVQGKTLKSLLQQQPLPSISTRLQWFVEITQALQRVHALDMLHLDLKTSNIMVRDIEKTITLIDFGLETRLLLEAGFLHEDEIYCTPYYVSPERIMGETPDARADLYALGVILYELLTGKKPYESTSLSTLLKMHAVAPIPRLPETFATYQPLLNQLMAKFPEGRLDSATNVLYWLHHHIV